MSNYRKPPDYPVAPILEYLGADNVPRVRGGGHRKMRCFQHVDNTPSASVGEFSYTCFSCGATGDAIKLLMQHANMTFAEAVAQCEELTGGGGSASDNRPAGGWAGDLLG